MALRYLAGWSFKASAPICNRHVLARGEEVTVSADVTNDGRRLGTVYLRFLIVDSYKRDAPVFDSHRDLSENSKHSLRAVDLLPRSTQRIACSWVVPSGNYRHCDVCVEIWNPHMLFGGPKPICFYRSDWHGGFEIVESTNQGQPRVFVSYAWDDDAHRRWVLQMCEELRKHDIEVDVDHALRGGDEMTLFMERGMSSPVVLLVCSSTYTTKANERRPGGVGFETIVGSNEFARLTSDERTRFIPIVRNNNLPTTGRLPKYLGSRKYIDMSGDDWKAEPMLDLVASIRRHL